MGLGHDRGVAELCDESLPALNGGIGDLRGLAGVEADPRATIDVTDHFNQTCRIIEVDESITNVGLGMEVDAEVEEVICAEAIRVQDGLQAQPVQLIGNIPQHDCSSDIQSTFNAANVNSVGAIVAAVGHVKNGTLPEESNQVAIGIARDRVNGLHCQGTNPSFCIVAGPLTSTLEYWLATG